MTNCICLLASNPQDPGHGSLHFCWIHACWLGHSLFRTHSGLQFGGAPMKFSIHEQAGFPEIIWQREFGPHGVGTHDGGLSVTIGSSTRMKLKQKIITKAHLQCKNSIWNKNYLLIRVHCVNGSPVNPNGQAQTGLWLFPWHSALIPQVCSQTSEHLFLMQALSDGHSELTIHSGWQFGGVPI